MTAPFTLVTGASSGIGRVVALTLARNRNLILNGRDEGRLNATRAECAARGADFGREALVFPCDLSRPQELGAALAAFMRDRGLRIDAFVHCAAIVEVLPMAKTRYHVGLEVMNVNYFSATEIISALLKRRVNGDALKDIVLITSIATTHGAPHQPHYCASKGALEALRIALARDLAPHVRVNAVAPGSFPTPMWETPLADPEWRQNWAPPTLLPPGSPQEVANTVEFLLSDKASYLTGVLLPVNGGEAFYR